MQKDTSLGHNKSDMNTSSVNKPYANVPSFSPRVSGLKELPYGDYYALYTEKMHKILIALYMVTDLVETNHSVKDTLRETAVQTLSFIYELGYRDTQGHTEKLHDIHTFLNECSSYFDVLFRTGYVSPMNYQVILAEMQKLQHLIEQHVVELENTNSIPRNARVENNITSSFFDDDRLVENKGHTETNSSHHRESEEEPNKETAIKDSTEEIVFVPKASLPSLIERYKNKRTLTKKVEPKKPKAQREPRLNEAKEERKNNILKILKQKKNASIKDIGSLFKDCSIKTIQRDLNELIDEHKVIKKGSRRWSTYNLI